MRCVVTLEKFSKYTGIIRVRCPYVREFTLVSFVCKHDNKAHWVAGVSIILEEGTAPRMLPISMAADKNADHAMNKSARMIRSIPQDITLANLLRS